MFGVDAADRLLAVAEARAEKQATLVGRLPPGPERLQAETILETFDAARMRRAGILAALLLGRA